MSATPLAPDRAAARRICQILRRPETAVHAPRRSDDGPSGDDAAWNAGAAWQRLLCELDADGAA
jgi:hypothetical protein